MTIEIPLTQGKVAIIDDADWDLVSVHKWYAHKGGRNNTWYAMTTVRRTDGTQKKILMHRLILGLTDPKIQGDHRDGDGLNNQRENLRICSSAQNQRNRAEYANNTSGFKGVSWHKRNGKWAARIMTNGKQKWLGLYQSKEEAHAAYCRAATEMHGDFANTGTSR